MIGIESQELGRWIHILSRQIKRRLDEAVSKFDVTSVQCAMIGFISNKGKKEDVFAKDIESNFNMRRATVAEVLSLMEKNDLIKREVSCEDGRLKKIILTKKSLKIKESFEKEIKKVEKELVDGITENERQELVRLINKMSENLKNKALEN